MNAIPKKKTSAIFMLNNIYVTSIIDGYYISKAMYM